MTVICEQFEYCLSTLTFTLPAHNLTLTFIDCNKISLCLFIIYSFRIYMRVCVSVNGIGVDHTSIFPPLIVEFTTM